MTSFKLSFVLLIVANLSIAFNIPRFNYHAEHLISSAFHRSLSNKAVLPFKSPSKRALLPAKAFADTSSEHYLQKDSKGSIPKDEVKRETLLWADASRPEGISNNNFVLVSTGKSLPVVLSQFWTVVVECVEAQNNNSKNREKKFTDLVLFVVPYCDILSDPLIMDQIDRTIDFCSGSCISFGKTILLQKYHPLLEGSGSASRRSPYPTFGLKILPKPIEIEGMKDPITQARMDLELLLNSPASSSNFDTMEPAEKRGYVGYPGSLPSAEYALEKTKTWVARLLDDARTHATYRGGSLFGPSKLMQEGTQPLVSNWVQNFETIFQYSISGSRTAEEILSDVWCASKELIAKSTEMRNNSIRNNSIQSPSISILFAVPRFHSFNAEAFKKFVATFSIVLQQTPIATSIDIECYHPEMISDEGKIDKKKRSPYPTIHLIHHGNNATS